MRNAISIRRVSAAVLAVGCLAVVSVVLTLIVMMMNLTGAHGDLLAAAEAGNVIAWVETPQFRATYPGHGIIDCATALIDPGSMALAAFALGLTWLVARRMLNVSALTLALVWLVVGGVVLGLAQTRFIIDPPKPVGPLLGFMLTSALYFALASAVLLGWSVVRGQDMAAPTV
jgi:hypothetical protein